MLFFFIAKKPQPGLAAYSATKGAVNMLAKGIAAEEASNVKAYNKT